jgi:predicted dehydrogenase
VHGVYDPNPGSIRNAIDSFKLFDCDHDLVVYNTLAEACNDPAVDGLVISTPNYTHIEVIREAVKSGKHILLEKPMATRIEHAYEILRLAENYPAVFQIGLQYRYKAIAAETIYEALQRGSIGAIQKVSIVEHRVPFLDKVKQWNKFSKYSGGTLVEKCCHYFDLLNLFSGSRPVSVYGSGSMAVNFQEFEYHGERSDILDNAFVIVKYANGVQATFDLCMFAPMFYEEIVLCGDRGYLRAFERDDFLPASGAPKSGLEVLRGENAPSRVSTPSYPEFIEQTGHQGATFYEHVNFVNNIEGLKTNTATVAEGFWSIVVAAAAEEAVKTGEVVMIDELLARNKIDL